MKLYEIKEPNDATGDNIVPLVRYTWQLGDYDLGHSSSGSGTREQMFYAAKRFAVEWLAVTQPEVITFDDKNKWIISGVPDGSADDVDEDDRGNLLADGRYIIGDYTNT